jgi:hypothetical protein
MTRRIKVEAVKKKEPNLHLYVLALIALAQELQAEEHSAAEPQEPAAPAQEDGAE